MVNETTICHKCGYEGLHNLFYRTDENGELITTDRKTACLSDIEEHGLSKARDIAQKRTHFDPKKFCPKCNYVNGSDTAIDDAYYAAWRERLRARIDSDTPKGIFANRGSCCMLLIFQLTSLAGVGYFILKY